MLNFGPCTVTYNSTNLGDTFGGVSLKLNVVERSNVGDMHPEKLVETGQGALNLYDYSTDITITNSTTLFDYGEVILDGSPRYKITLYSCKLLINDSIDVGKNEQKAFVVELLFKRSEAGNLIKFE